MRARRALAIAITTPFLLATIGMTGASAAAPQKSTAEGPIARPEPIANGTGGAADEFGEDEMRPEEELVTRFAGQLLSHVVPVKGGKAEAVSQRGF
jgi:hypothetical protein